MIGHPACRRPSALGLYDATERAGFKATFTGTVNQHSRPRDHLQPRDFDQHPRPVDLDRLPALAGDGVPGHQRCEAVGGARGTAGASN